MRQNNGTVYFKTAQTCILVWDYNSLFRVKICHCYKIKVKMEL